MEIEALSQKHAVPPLPESCPQEYAGDGDGIVLVDDRADVEELLDVFVRYFRTHLFSHVTWATPGDVTLRTLHRVVMFELPDQKDILYAEDRA
jgi:hypothetical protein